MIETNSLKNHEYHIIKEKMMQKNSFFDNKKD